MYGGGATARVAERTSSGNASGSAAGGGLGVGPQRVGQSGCCPISHTAEAEKTAAAAAAAAAAPSAAMTIATSPSPPLEMLPESSATSLEQFGDELLIIRPSPPTETKEKRWNSSDRAEQSTGHAKRNSGRGHATVANLGLRRASAGPGSGVHGNGASGVSPRRVSLKDGTSSPRVARPHSRATSPRAAPRRASSPRAASPRATSPRASASRRASQPTKSPSSAGKKSFFRKGSSHERPQTQGWQEAAKHLSEVNPIVAAKSPLASLFGHSSDNEDENDDDDGRRGGGAGGSSSRALREEDLSSAINRNLGESSLASSPAMRSSMERSEGSEALKPSGRGVKVSPWTEHDDPISGRSFWHNEETGETTWERQT